MAGKIKYGWVKSFTNILWDIFGNSVRVSYWVEKTKVST